MRFGSIVLTVAVEELFVGSGSSSNAVTEAVLETVPGAEGTFSTRLIVAPPPFASVPSVQVTVVVPLHDPCDDVADTNVDPEGTTSVMTTLLALPGPLLTTWML